METRKELLIVKKGALSSYARTELRREGWSVIEVDDPRDVRRLSPDLGSSLTPDASASALLDAIVAVDDIGTCRLALRNLATSMRKALADQKAGEVG